MAKYFAEVVFFLRLIFYVSLEESFVCLFLQKELLDYVGMVVYIEKVFYQSQTYECVKGLETSYISDSDNIGGPLDGPVVDELVKLYLNINDGLIGGIGRGMSHYLIDSNSCSVVLI